MASMATFLTPYSTAVMEACQVEQSDFVEPDCPCSVSFAIAFFDYLYSPFFSESFSCLTSKCCFES